MHDDRDRLLNTGLCLLSLDGGGIRGLLTLYILRNIMAGLNHQRQAIGLKPWDPWQIFNLIGGIGTGG